MTEQSPEYTPTTTDLVSQLYTLRKTKSAIEKAEKDILAQLKPLVDPDLDILSTDKTAKLTLDLYELSRVPGTNRTLKADKLLERGVSPEVIDFATSTTTYYRYAVKMLDDPES